jgi:GT2 family glycosyltransferase
MISWTAIISFRDNQSYLEALLDSFAKHLPSGSIHEIIVVDSDSQKPPLISDSFPFVVKVLHNPAGSLTTSLNMGLEACKTDWVGIFDADTEITGGDIASLPERALEDGADLVVPRSISEDGSRQDYFDNVDTVTRGYVFTRPLLSLFHRRYRRKKLITDQSIQPVAIRYFWNQCVFVNLKKIRSSFLYNPRLAVWACDFDLSRRLREANIRMIALPSVAIIHHGGGSGSVFSSRRAMAVTRSEILYVTIHFPRSNSILHVVSLLFHTGKFLFKRFRPRQGKAERDVEWSIIRDQFRAVRDRRQSNFEIFSDSTL